MQHAWKKARGLLGSRHQHNIVVYGLEIILIEDTRRWWRAPSSRSIFVCVPGVALRVGHDRDRLSHHGSELRYLLAPDSPIGENLHAIFIRASIRLTAPNLKLSTANTKLDEHGRYSNFGTSKHIDTMARGNQREQAREKNLAKLAGSVRMLPLHSVLAVDTNRERRNLRILYANLLRAIKFRMDDTDSCG